MLYHGTSEKYLTQILQHGIQPSGRAGISNWDHSCHSNPDAVYLSNAYALYFAYAALKDEHDTARLLVLEIDETMLDSSLLCADEDALEQAGRGRDGLPKQWDMKRRNAYYKTRMQDYSYQDSLDALGTCAYLDTIPVSALRRAVCVEQNTYQEMVLRGYDPAIVLVNYQFVGDKYRATTRWLFDPDSVANATEELCGLPITRYPFPATRAGIEVLDLSPQPTLTPSR